jgi:hypothetical protein
MVSIVQVVPAVEEEANTKQEKHSERDRISTPGWQKFDGKREQRLG